MADDDRCATCCNAHITAGLCLARADPVPLDDMRTTGECGPTAKLYDPPGLDDIELIYD